MAFGPVCRGAASPGLSTGPGRGCWQHIPTDPHMMLCVPLQPSSRLVNEINNMK